MDSMEQTSSKINMSDRPEFLLFFQQKYSARINYLSRAKPRLNILPTSGTSLPAWNCCRKFLLETEFDVKGAQGSVRIFWIFIFG
jgi:hypothetical protein